MRRVMAAVLGTIIGTTLLVGLKATGSPPLADPLAGAPFDPTGGSDPGGSRAPGQPTRPGTTPKPGTTTPAPGQTTTQPGTTTSQPGGGTTPTPPQQRTLTGAVIAVKSARSPNPKGSNCGDCATYSMTVSIVVIGSQITTISASYAPGISGKNLDCYNKAVSTLKQRAPHGYPSPTTVSGATYSANAYLQSLQSAMSQI